MSTPEMNLSVAIQGSLKCYALQGSTQEACHTVDAAVGISNLAQQLIDSAALTCFGDGCSVEATAFQLESAAEAESTGWSFVPSFLTGGGSSAEMTTADRLEYTSVEQKMVAEALAAALDSETPVSIARLREVAGEAQAAHAAEQGQSNIVRTVKAYLSRIPGGGTTLAGGFIVVCTLSYGFFKWITAPRDHAIGRGRARIIVDHNKNQ